MVGVYVLLIWVKRKRKMRIGKRGPLVSTRGFYFYGGRAFNGLAERIKRHLEEKGKKFLAYRLFT